MTRAGALAQVYRVFVKEVRELVRDRNTLVYSVLMPMFLYPGCLWISLQAIAFLKGSQERREVSIAVSDQAGGKLESRLAASSRAVRVLPQAAALAEESARSGAVGAAVVLEPAEADHGLRASRAAVYHRSSVDDSARARALVESELAAFRRGELTELAREADLPAGEIEAPVVRHVDVTSTRERSEHMAGLIVPILSLVMMVIGALYPALETTVGERERGTLETTLAAPTRRGAIVTGKYLAVAAFALASYGFNFGSVSFTLYHLQAQLGGRQELLFEVSAGLLITTAASAALIALLVSSLMMVIGFSVRTFKEGQAYLGPAFALVLAPAALVLGPDVRLGWGLAFVPIANLLLVVRDAIAARALSAQALAAFGVSLCVAGAALALATRLVRNEDYVMGGGLLSRRWRAPWRRSPPEPEERG